MKKLPIGHTPKEDMPVMEFSIQGYATQDTENLIMYANKGWDMAIAIRAFQDRIHHELRKGTLQDLGEEHESIIRDIVRDGFERVQAVVDTVE